MHARPEKSIAPFILWGAVIAVSIMLIYLFKGILLPFVLGFTIAYLFNPIVGRLSNIGISRKPAALVIVGGFLLLILGIGALFFPVVSREISHLLSNLPYYINRFWEYIEPLTGHVEEYLGNPGSDNFGYLLQDKTLPAFNAANFAMQKVAAGGIAILDILSVIVLTPVVAYFMIKEWPDMTRRMYELIPRRREATVKELLNQIHSKLSGFIRGQITVALVLALSYAIALSLAGLKYGILIGLLSGFLSLIPMVGSTVGLLVSIAVAWFQSEEISYVLIIAGIFVTGQIIEGNFLTPRLMGKSVGMHPLWVFFAILAGGFLLGILGMFIAVPIAAIIGVFVSYAISKYKKSEYYNGPKHIHVHPQNNKKKKNKRNQR